MRKNSSSKLPAKDFWKGLDQRKYPDHLAVKIRKKPSNILRIYSVSTRVLASLQQYAYHVAEMLDETAPTCSEIRR